MQVGDGERGKGKRKEEGPSAFVGGEDCCCKAREAERLHPQRHAGCKLVELTTWTGWWKLEVHSFWIKPRAGWGQLEVHPYRPKGGPHCRELPRAHKTQLICGSFPPSSADLSQVIFLTAWLRYNCYTPRCTYLMYEFGYMYSPLMPCNRHSHASRSSLVSLCFLLFFL